MNWLQGMLPRGGKPLPRCCAPERACRSLFSEVEVLPLNMPACGTG